MSEPTHWTIKDADEDTVCLLGELFAYGLQRGDLITLTGDLGAGKTTFVRALIKALMRDAGINEQTADIPSPTYTLLQPYDGLITPVIHGDLYRLGAPEEVIELGLDEALRESAVLIEWPDKAAGELPQATFAITLSDHGASGYRSMTVTASDAVPNERLARLRAIWALLRGSAIGGSSHTLNRLTGDASSRRYGRLTPKTTTDTKQHRQPLVLMDWPAQPDGPPLRDGKPYSRLVHLAEDVRAYIIVAAVLADHRLKSPRILAVDEEAGLLLQEDFGDAVFAGLAHDETAQETLWRAAIDVLLQLPTLKRTTWQAPEFGLSKTPSFYDRDALGCEIELLMDWYWPMIHGAPATPSDRETFSTVWRPIIHALHRDVESQDWCLTLRDFHSPNLLQLAPETQAQSDSMHLPGSPAPHSEIGLIDFQDAVNGPPAYDLVSLLQDARVDVPERLAEELLEAYIAGRGQAAPDDPFAQPDYLRRMVAFCGAQRATKILGIFARLHVRDGKSGYLVHLPRVRRDLEKNLQHPDLSEVANWFHRAFPA